MTMTTDDDWEFTCIIEIQVSSTDPLSAAERAWETLTELYKNGGVEVDVFDYGADRFNEKPVLVLIQPNEPPRFA